MLSLGLKVLHSTGFRADDFCASGLESGVQSLESSSGRIWGGGAGGGVHCFDTKQ